VRLHVVGIVENLPAGEATAGSKCAENKDVQSPPPCSTTASHQRCSLWFRAHVAAAAASDSHSTTLSPTPAASTLNSAAKGSLHRGAALTCSQSTSDTWAVCGGGLRRSADESRRALDAAVLQGL
jgi:hypothetical protein